MRVEHALRLIPAVVVVLALLAAGAWVLRAFHPDLVRPETPSSESLPPELPVSASVQPTAGQGLPAEWWIPLQPGEAFEATVEQLGTDVVVELRRPNGEIVLTVDQPIGGFGPEPVCFVDHEGSGVILGIRPFAGVREDRSQGSPYRLVLHRRGRVSDDAASNDGTADRLRRCWEALRAFSDVVRRFRHEGEATPALLAEAKRARDAWGSAEFRFESAVVWAEMAAIARAMEDLRAELRYRRAALALLEGQETTPGLLSLRALLLNDLGLTYDAMGEIRKAEESYAEALELYRELGAPAAEATVLNNQARLILDQGAGHEALAIYQRVVEIARREKAPRLEAHAHLNHGSVLSEMGDFPRALDAFAEARELFTRLEEVEGRASAALATGWAHTLAGREETGLAWIEKALDLATDAGLLAVEAAARDRLGTTLRRLGRLDEARSAYLRALELARSMGRRRDEAHVLANLGWLEVEARQPREALRPLTEACELLSAMGNLDALSYALAGLARAERRLGDLEEALGHIAEAVDLVELQRSVARGQGHRLLGVPLWPDYRALLVDVLMDLHAERPDRGYDRRAFQEADLARARHLYETLQDALVDLEAEAPLELLAREQRIRQEIRVAQRRLSRRTETATETEMQAPEDRRRELRRRLAELKDVRAEIRRSSPRLAELRDPEVVSVEELQHLLELDTTLLSFHLGDERSFVFVVGREMFEAVELPARVEIESLARAFYEGVSRRSAWSSQMKLIARQLTATVIEPVSHHLSGGRLLVAADGLLHHIPWVALPWPGEAGPLGESHLVLEHAEVVSVPSATVLRTLHQIGRGPWRVPDSIAVLADPEYPNDGPWSPLPFSRLEAEAIRHVAGPSKVRLFLGPQAHPGVVRNGDLDGAEVIHFASHALIDEEEPALSHIALSELASDRPGAGDLYLHEIYGLDLDADLVVLSGCRTALGQAVRGEGLVGLTRGFFFVGTPRLLVSLWAVDDAATAALMKGFYRSLFEGLRPATALALAQEQVRRTPGWEHPVYWAGFVLQGDWR